MKINIDIKDDVVMDKALNLMREPMYQMHNIKSVGYVKTYADIFKNTEEYVKVVVTENGYNVTVGVRK